MTTQILWWTKCFYVIREREKRERKRRGEKEGGEDFSIFTTLCTIMYKQRGWEGGEGVEGRKEG